MTSKTNEFVEISVHPELASALANRPHQDQRTFIVGVEGKPYCDSWAFSRQLAKEMRRLGLPRLTFHGLRYAACARLEDLGCSPYEVEDIVGHRTLEMAKKYMSSDGLGRSAKSLEEAT